MTTHFLNRPRLSRLVDSDDLHGVREELAKDPAIANNIALATAQSLPMFQLLFEALPTHRKPKHVARWLWDGERAFREWTLDAIAWIGPIVGVDWPDPRNYTDCSLLQGLLRSDLTPTGEKIAAALIGAGASFKELTEDQLDRMHQCAALAPAVATRQALELQATTAPPPSSARRKTL